MEASNKREQITLVSNTILPFHIRSNYSAAQRIAEAEAPRNTATFARPPTTLSYTADLLFRGSSIWKHKVQDQLLCSSVQSNQDRWGQYIDTICSYNGRCASTYGSHKAWVCKHLTTRHNPTGFKFRSCLFLDITLFSEPTLNTKMHQETLRLSLLAKPP